MIRALILIVALPVLAACTAPTEDLSLTPEPIGDFRLGHNIAIADDTQRGPFSRGFTETQIEATLQKAVADRLRRYDGDGLYHLGMNVGGLVLAQPGIPLIYAPSSVMIVDVTVFNNRTKAKLNEEPKRFQMGEGLQNAVPILGSGLTRDADTQLANISVNFAKQLEEWLQENPEWFVGEPGAVRVPYNATTQAPLLNADPDGEATPDDN